MKYDPKNGFIEENGVVTAAVRDFYDSDNNSEKFHAQLARRINSHDDLVAALKKYMALVQFGECYEAARAALAKAGAA